MTKHTPGPWLFEIKYGDTVEEEKSGPNENVSKTFTIKSTDYFIGEGEVYISTHIRCSITCECRGGEYVCEAEDLVLLKESDAHLIAAAPDLLAALKMFREVINAVNPGGIEVVDKAIAKAEGRS